jgi:hypothetical protein
MRDLGLGHTLPIRRSARRCSIAETMTTSGLPPRSGSEFGLRPVEGLDSLAHNVAAVGLGLDDDFDFEDYEPTLGDRFRRLIGRGLIRIGWLGLAAALAFGSAGIVAATEHSPSSGARPELNYDADKALGDKLDGAIRDLARLKDDVDSLGSMARKTLAGLSSVNALALKDAADRGSNNIASIEAAALSLNKRLDCGTWSVARQTEMLKTHSRTMIDRYRKVCEAVASVAPLRLDWDSLMSGSATAMEVADDVNTHDALAEEALVLATQGRYPEALVKLKGAALAIADASSIATLLSNVTDVSTLTRWLNRTKSMDDALRLLWQTMIESEGRVNAQVTAALKAVADAKALLPNSTDVLQVVMYELAGNLTTNGISIELAKGALSEALADLTGTTVVGASQAGSDGLAHRAEVTTG